MSVVVVVESKCEEELKKLKLSLLGLFTTCVLRDNADVVVVNDVEAGVNKENELLLSSSYATRLSELKKGISRYNNNNNRNCYEYLTGTIDF